ncbi:28663_t:CDS:2, partial [Racocetra persica]
GKNVQEIIPDSHDYETELEKEMQRRIKDIVMKDVQRKKQSPTPKPTPPTREEEDEHAQEARQFTLNILSDYQDYAENILCLGVIIGQKSAGEKFA